MNVTSQYRRHDYRVVLLLLSLLLVVLPVNVVLAEQRPTLIVPVSAKTQPPKIKYSKLKPAQKLSDDSDDRQALSLDELETLSRKFVQTLNSKKPAEFALLLDEDAIIQTSILAAIQKLGNLSAVADNIRRGIRIIPNLFISKMGSQGSIKFIRIIERASGKRALLRLKFNSGELTYLELIASKNDNGELRIIDFYDAMLGRLYTTIVSQLLTTPVKEEKDFDKILYFKNTPFTFQQRYAKTINFYNNGEYKQALNSFQHLPPKFKASRHMLLLRIQIAKAVNKIAYREALMLLNNHFPDAPELALLLSDHYYFSKQYPRTLQLISSYSDYIGGDVALDNLKVKLYIQLKDYKQAIRIGSVALNTDGNYQDLYWLMLKAYLNTYQYERVGDILDVLLDKFNANIALDSFYKEPFYREYGYSKQFKKWKATRVSMPDK